MDWKECFDKKIVKDIIKDEEMIVSLIETSESKLKSMERLKLDNVTSGSKLSLAYDSLRELLEALSIKNGYKIYNHECYTAFLKEILDKSSEGEEFDEIRKVRNSVNYYGKKLSLEDTEEVIKRIIDLRKVILDMLL